MASQQDVENALEAFRTFYNPEGSLRVAKEKSIKAALQRNHTYPTGFDYHKRKEFRMAWSEILDNFIKSEYQTFTEKEFISVAQKYKYELLKKAPQINFKLSHAQKSLSLYAKHCWSLGEIPEPMICPVDRMILVAAGAPASIQTWTKVDTEAEYLAQFDLIKKAAEKSSLTVAQWELFSFPPTKQHNKTKTRS